MSSVTTAPRQVGAVEHSRREGAVRGLRRAGAVLAPPIVFGILFVLFWQTFVKTQHIKPYVLAAPSDIWSGFTHQHDKILEAMIHSGLNALVGLIVGTFFGVVFAAIAARFPIAGGTISPLVAGLAALAFTGAGSADPGQTPHGYVGSCNGMTASNAGMNNAINHANMHGIDGMITSILNTSSFGPPEFCP